MQQFLCNFIDLIKIKLHVKMSNKQWQLFKTTFMYEEILFVIKFPCLSHRQRLTLILNFFEIILINFPRFTFLMKKVTSTL